MFYSNNFFFFFGYIIDVQKCKSQKTGNVQVRAEIIIILLL